MTDIVDDFKKRMLTNEQIVFSVFFNYNKLLYKYVDKLTIDHFSTSKHKIIFKTLKKMVNNKDKFSLVTFIETAGKSEYGGKIYLEKLKNIETEKGKNIENHIQKLKESYIKLSVHNNQIPDLYEAVINPDATLEEVKDHLQTILDHVKSCKTSTDIKKSDVLYQEYIDKLEDRWSGHSFYPIGIDGLDNHDEITEGLAPGKLTVVGARPSLGKTSFCINIADGLINKGKKVLYIALEPTSVSLMDAITAKRSKIQRNFLLKNIQQLTPKQIDKIIIENEKLRDKNLLHIYDGAKADVKLIETLLESDNYYVAIIDLFEKLVDIDTEASIISDKLDEIQTIAKSTKVHVIIVQQLKREVDYRKDKRPRISDFKNSGKYEEVADNIFLLYSEKYYKPQLEDHFLDVIVAKQREGKKNFVVTFKFEPEFSRIEKVINTTKLEMLEEM